MALQPEERFNNIKRALFNHIETNYTETTKWFQGSNVLDTTAITEWVWFGIVATAGRRFLRQVRDSNFGNLTTILVQAIIYLKPTATIIRVDAIRDEVVNVLRRPNIQIVDRVGSAGNLGKLVGQDILNENDLGIENDLHIYQITFAMDFIEEFT